MRGKINVESFASTGSGSTLDYAYTLALSIPYPRRGCGTRTNARANTVRSGRAGTRKGHHDALMKPLATTVKPDEAAATSG